MLDALNQFANALMENLIDYIVYAAIAGVTIIGVFKCLLPLVGTRRALRRAIRKLQQDAGTRQGTPVWQEKRFVGVRLKGTWLRFLQNAEQLDRRGLPCNVEDYINDDTVVHGPGNAQLAELVPSLLTSLGILGTFMGMMSGLSGLDFSDSANIINSIPTLLDGMKFAFGTSVAGVSCSICFNMINRVLQGSGYRAIDDFVECFTSLAMSRPLDNDVQLICQNQDSNHMLSGLTEVLPGTLAQVMESSVSRVMTPVAQAMDNFLIGATRAQVDGVSRIVGSFVQQMNTSLNDQFIQLGRTMTEINQNQQVAMTQVTASMQAATAIVADAQQLRSISQDVMDRFSQYMQELSASRARDERFELSAAQLLSNMQRMSEGQAQSLQALGESHRALLGCINQYAQQNATAAETLQSAARTDAQQLQEATTAMQNASAELSASCQGFVTSVVTGLSQSLGMFDQNMTSLMTLLTEKIDRLSSDGGSADTTDTAAELQRLLTQLRQIVDAASAPGALSEEG
ncbi:MAG: MotA/TolQ/ExbB proton channel family protein [Clostridia bacterium]|nr:MotA/TolQ/ExbB proton channel family protein [Clostridia bacterium]